MGLVAVIFIGATANIPALGQDEKHYREASDDGSDSKDSRIDARPAVSKGWRSVVAQLNRAAQGGPVDVYFLGDSLTQFWQSQGQAVWALDFAPLNAGNFGIAADRVENILWRLQNGNLGKLQPKVFVLMMGTNNLAATPSEPPAKVVRGIVEVLSFITQARPSARVLLLSILPNGNVPHTELRKSIVETNRSLAEHCQQLAAVTFVDVHDAFIDAGGQWKPALTLDGTHLSARGYDVLSTELRPVLAEALQAKPAGKGAP